MKLNRLNQDTEFCGKVPLHQTNMIQPHGVLLIVDKNDLNILQVSENILEILDKPAADVAGTSLSSYIAPDEVRLLNERFASPIEGKIPFTFSLQRHGALKKFLALVQAQPNYYIMEVDKDTAST